MPLLRIESGLVVDLLPFAAAAGVCMATPGLRPQVARDQKGVEFGLRPVRRYFVDIGLYPIPGHSLLHMHEDPVGVSDRRAVARKFLDTRSKMSAPRSTAGTHSGSLDFSVQQQYNTCQDCAVRDLRGPFFSIHVRRPVRFVKCGAVR